MAKTPALTTATACNKALTGVGATMAAGSHRWKGINAAFPIPNTNSANKMPTTGPDALPERMPPT